MPINIDYENWRQQGDPLQMPAGWDSSWAHGGAQPPPSGGSQPVDSSNWMTEPPAGSEGLWNEVGGIQQPEGVAHSFEDFQKQFALSDEERARMEENIRGGFADEISSTKEFGRKATGGTVAAGARSSRGDLGYDSVVEGEIRNIEKETQKQLTNIEAQIQLAILNKEDAKVKALKESYTQWQTALESAQKRKLDIINTKLSILSENRAAESDQATFTGYYKGQETLDMKQFKSDDAYRKTQTDLAKKQFELDVQKFGVDKAISIAQQNGVQVKYNPQTGQIDITDIMTPDAAYTKAKTDEIMQLLPLQIKKLQAEIAKTNSGGSRGRSGSTISDYMQAIQQLQAMPEPGATSDNMSLDPTQLMTKEMKMQALQLIQAQMYDDFADVTDEGISEIKSLFGTLSGTNNEVTGSFYQKYNPSTGAMGVWSKDDNRFLSDTEVTAIGTLKGQMGTSGWGGFNVPN